MNRFSVPELHTVTRALAGVASGRDAPDLVITGARILSTYTERILEDREVWISKGRIAAVKPAGACPKKRGCGFHDAAGGILAPGLVDPHVHIESSMMTVCAYAEAALLNGTTTLFCDSHEIGNVGDAEAIEWMLQDAREAPLSVFLTVPSTIPATHPGLETAGGDLTPEKIGALFDKWPEAVALGEKMDHVPVFLGEERSHAVIAEALQRGRPVCGHCYGREFVAAYAASGITDTHEAIDRDICEDFLEAGLYIFMRAGNPGTAWHALPDIIKVVTELGVSTKRLCLCTDDRDADDLFNYGLDWCVRETVREGIDRIRSWCMGSLHGATRYAMDGETGGLGHGRRADIVLLDDDLKVQNTWYGGRLMVEGGKITPLLDERLSHHRWRYPEVAYRTVRFRDGLKLIPDAPETDLKANVIRVELPGVASYREVVPLEGGRAWPEHFEKHNLCFVSVVERYGKTGNVGLGLMQDFHLKSGAVASSVGHDAHNIVVAGVDEEDMRTAIETIRDHNGGIVIVEDGQVLALVPLPIAGLLSDKRASAVRDETVRFKQVWEAKGIAIPYMGFNLIPLSVIPDFRLTDVGLVLVKEMRLLPLFE